MLSTYANTLITGGFAIQQVLEPQAPATVTDRVPGYRVAPAFLLMRCAKK
jgi:hypothetical protein